MESDRSLFLQARGVPLESLMAWARRSVRRFPSGLRMEGCFDPSCQRGDRLRTSLRRGFFRCWECGAAGDVVKAASLLWGMSQADAARRLLAQAAQLAVAATVSDAAHHARVLSAQAVALREVCDAVFRTGWLDARGREALLERCIPPSVIDEAVRCEQLVCLPADPRTAHAAIEKLVGHAALEQAGLCSAAGGHPAVAYRPLWLRHGAESFEARALPSDDGCSSDARPTQARGTQVLRYGMTRQPFQLKAARGATASAVGVTHVAKSPLDAMSLRALGIEGRVMGLPGVASWRRADEAGLPNGDWFAGVRSAVIAFPGDEGGREAANALRDHLAAAGIPAQVMDVAPGCDVNHMLMGMMLL